jgi:branched-chain amino acid transport system permease protein
MARYGLALLTFGGIYAICGVGMNVQWAHSGVSNLGFIANFAIGAYASVLLTREGLPLLLGPLSGLVLGAAVAYPVGKLMLRLTDDYLAILGFGFAIVVQVLLLNLGFTNGVKGIAGVPSLLRDVDLDVRPYAQAAMTVIALLAAIFLAHRLTESPYGRLLRAIRDNPEAVASLGKRVSSYRLAAMMIGLGLAGLAGGLYAHYIGFISPDQFDYNVSFMILAGIILGGSAHWAAAIGTLLLVTIIQGTSFLNIGLPISESQFAQLRLVMIGVALIGLMRFRPQGLRPYRHRVRTARRPVS